MIITLAREDGKERIYLTRFASVCCYLTDDGSDAGGCTLTVEPGLYAYPPEFERIAPAVEEAILAELAARIGIEPDHVLQQPFARLKSLADPELPEHYRFAKRTKNRAYPRN